MRCISRSFTLISVLVIILLFTNPFSTIAGPLPDTGQAGDYTAIFGEDSDYTINPQSYTKLDEQGNELDSSATVWAMVRDNITGLIWEVKTDDGTAHDKDDKYNWNDSQDIFIKALNDAGFGGFSDWRLPTVKELTLIINRDTYNPAINTDYFPETMPSYYWTFTTDPSYQSVALRVRFDYGYVNGYGKSNSYHVRAVRGAETTSNEFIINGDGTVTDILTGLMWQQETGVFMDWESALNYCETLTLAGYNDWRLPDINELQSIVDYSRFDPAIDANTFPNTQSSIYWSSTTDDSYPSFAWQVYFNYGNIYSYNKSNLYYVRAVRGGQSSPHSVLLIISVTDTDSGDPIAEANIAISNMSQGAGERIQTTDPNGMAKFLYLPIGEYSLEITAPGYLPLNDVINLTQGGSVELAYSTQSCTLYFMDMDQDDFGLDTDSSCLLAPDHNSGYTALVAGDCDDTDPGVYPGANEQCDGKDNNCDNVIPANEADDDSDGMLICAGDCNDSNSVIYTGAPELCDGMNNDCNADTADGIDEVWLGQACDGADSDLCEEGIYECMGGMQTCSDATGDDLEACDGIDNNCDGQVDEGPWPIEICDGLDNNCNGQRDEGVLIKFYWDEDGDGYGDMNRIDYGCSVPSEYVLNGVDCDDSDPYKNPMKTMTGESLEGLKDGKNILTGLAHSCAPYSTYKLLRDFKALGQTLTIQYKETDESPCQSTYWFFGEVCGEDIPIDQDPMDEEIFIINKIPF